MPRTRHASIATRLTVANTLVCSAALVLVSLAVGLYDRTTFRTMVVRNLATQAQILGANSITALLFNDPAAAEATLAALRSAPNIVSAAIHTPDGRVFAAYPAGDGRDASVVLSLETGQTETSRFEAESVALTHAIVFNGKQVGSVTIRSDLQALTTRRTQFIGMMAAVFVLSLMAALLLSWLTQRAISTPIVHLAEMANRVSGANDYSVRATVTQGTREIDVLADAFNGMLEQIQRQDQSLQDAAHGLEDRVHQRTAELQTVNAELEAFSYSVSHDLRAPLRHVSGFANLLDAHLKGQIDERGRKYLDTITASATRMGRLIDDLLTFSRIGRGSVAASRVNLNDLVRDARQEVASDSPAGGRVVEWCVGTLPEVHADMPMLRAAIVNLLSNAMKYTSTRPTTRIEIGTCADTPGEVVVFVRDNGVGFDMRYANKLFGVFQRLHRSDEFEGTGIGLANVKRIIHRHGGRVWAEGEVGRGATFYFSLPRREARA